MEDKPDTEDEKSFEGADTYIRLKIRVSPPLTPDSATLPYPTFDALVPAKPPLPKFLPSIDASHDFRRQAKLAARAIAAEYHSSFAEQLEQRSGEVESRREAFLYDFNLSGKSHVLKSKLKKSITKIAR